MSDSNTTPKQRGGITGKGFVKGDPRINRKGRPKTFDALRAEAVKIAGEILTATGPDGAKVEASRIHTIMLDWATSKDPRKQALFVEYAFGKVPSKSELSGPDGGPVVVASLKEAAQAEQELREWRQQQLEQLSGLNVVQTPPTSSTTTA